MVQRILSEDEEEVEQRSNPRSGPLGDRSNKRARVDREGRAVKRESVANEHRRGTRSGRRAEDSEDDASPVRDFEEGGDAADEETVRPKFETQPRDKDGYVPGSIVRMKLTDFLTYDDAEFRPGPYLNMVLGPNGTGKSSIACAICLGLAFPLKLLGRAAEISSFVKIGSKKGEATVEIELKGPANKKNIIIKRTFQATSKTSTFTLNGKSATQRDVQERVRTLNVQVDNLCSFLPQDRVAEFAGMTPVELLKATQVAAGDGQLTKWHNDLIGRSADQKKANSAYTEVVTKLAHERQQNERIKVEVEKYEQRQRILDDIAFWEAVSPYVEYSDAFKAHREVKEAYRVAKAKLHELMGRNRPLTELMEHWQSEADRLQTLYNKQSEEVKKTKYRLKKALEPYSKAEEATDAMQKKLDQLDEEEESRRKELENLTKKMAQFQSKLNNPPPFPESLEDIESDRDRVRQEFDSIREAKHEVDVAMQALAREEANVKTVVSNAEQNLRNLTQVTGRRMQNLHNWDIASFTVADWLQKNQNKFKMEVFLPPCISVSVPDKSYQSAVEACFSVPQMKTFVAQCQEDYQLFNQLINSGEGIMNPRTNKPCRVNVWYRGPSDLPPPPIPRGDLRTLGFDCYAIDKVECPAGLRYFLEVEVALHRTPLALNEQRISADNTMNRIAQSPAGRGTFIGGRSKFQVQKSSYGQRLPFMSSTPVREARSFRDTAASVAETREAETRLREAKADVARIADRIREQQAVEQQHLGRQNANGEARAKIDQRQTEYNKVKNWVKKNELELERATKEHTRLLNAPSMVTAQATAKRDYVKTLMARKKCLHDYNEALFSLMHVEQKICSTALLSIQGSANYQKLRALNNKQDMKTMRATEDVKQKKERTEVAKATLAALQERTKEHFDSVSDSIRARFEAMENKEALTIAEVQEKVDYFRNELDANFAVNGHVVDQYKRRLEMIAQLEAREESYKRNLDKINTVISRVRAKWYPALKTLINGIGERFSAAFDRMGCAGEIRVTETEDYATWTLDILVKFRSSEKLQQLTAHRQSGGERSLTTILYLMSLAEYARAPFSLVDEINQGMDNRAERAVHDQLVQVTCRGDAGQYFLITPKLLPDLTYHKRMRILCINNGDWLPEQRVGSLRSLVENYARAHGIR